MRLLFLIALGLASLASAQVNTLFGNGKAVVYQEQELDRRFRRSQIANLLNEGTEDRNCAQVVGGLLTALGEVAPRLHKRDETFLVDPVLLHALNAQLDNARFSGTQFLASMVREVMLTRKLPSAWLRTATQLNEKYRIIDLAKLRFLAAGIEPIDSHDFTLAEFRRRHLIETERATTVNPVSEDEFRDRYLDRELAWTDMKLLDVVPEAALGKKLEMRTGDESGDLFAELEWSPQREEPQLTLFSKKEKLPAVRVLARLRTKQFVDLAKLQRGRPITVRGRLWDMNRTLTQIALREALLFETKDWTGAVLADPKAVWSCPAAVNEVTGIAPNQPGGFTHGPATKEP